MKKEGTKKTKANETQKNVSIAMEKIKDTEKEYKEELNYGKQDVLLPVPGNRRLQRLALRYQNG